MIDAGTALIIPLVAGEPYQSVDVTLDGVPFTLTLLWNDRAQYWKLSIALPDGTPILSGVKMVQNYPLTGRYRDARLPKGDFGFMNYHTLRPDFNSVGGACDFVYFPAS